MLKLHFDTMKISDIEDVIKIEERNYPIAWSKGIMKDCIKTAYHCITLKEGGYIIAYAFLMTSFDESHLLNMCVDKPYQGKGLGRKILKHLENICKINQSEVFLLEVRESNPVAQHLYHSFGFNVIGVRKNYYRCIKGRENAIVMTKNLINPTES